MFKVYLYEDRGWEFEPFEREVESVEVKTLADIEKIGKKLYEKYPGVCSVKFAIDEHKFEESYFLVEVLEMPE